MGRGERGPSPTAGGRGGGGSWGCDTAGEQGARAGGERVPRPHPLVTSGFPSWSPAPPCFGVTGCSRDRGAGLTSALPGAAHVLRYPAHGAEQVGQVRAGHLAAHEVLQVGGAPPRPRGWPRLQVQDLGLEGLRSQSRGAGGREGARAEGARGAGVGSARPARTTDRFPARAGPVAGNRVLLRLSHSSCHRGPLDPAFGVVPAVFPGSTWTA